jgi:DNA-binding LacI/PurR family transcriptional regulator
VSLWALGCHPHSSSAARTPAVRQNPSALPHHGYFTPVLRRRAASSYSRKRSSLRPGSFSGSGGGGRWDDVKTRAPKAVRRGPVVLVLDHLHVYQMQLQDGVRGVLAAAGIPLIVYANDSFAVELRSPIRHLLHSPGVRGVITTVLGEHAAQADLTATLNANRLPTVGIGAEATNAWSVGADNALGMRALMRHLLDDAGAKRIAILRGLEHHTDAREREAIVYAELAARGLHPEFVLDGGFERELAYVSISRLLKTSAVPDAIVAMNDRSAVGAMDALDDAGLRVPEDVMVTGFDDDVIAQECSPTLTTVSQDVVAQGALAAQLLLSHIDGVASAGHVAHPSALVVRGSTLSAEPDEDAEVTASIAMLAESRAVTALDDMVRVNRAFMACASVPDLLAELASNVDRLRLRRCFVVLYDDADRGVVVFSQTDGMTHVTPDAEPFLLADFLPADLQPEISRGSLTMLPLSVETRDLGYVLYEEVVPSRSLGELLRTDLSRAIDSLPGKDRQSLPVL